MNSKGCPEVRVVLSSHSRLPIRICACARCPDPPARLGMLGDDLPGNEGLPLLTLQAD
jgi:hypothetical protein